MSLNDPSRPVDAYKAIIDQLVEQTSKGVTEMLVSSEGIFSRAASDQDLNDFVQSLTSSQRVLLSRMLHTERTDTIHDVLAVLSWWVQTRKVGFTFRGEPMPLDLSGMGLHGDYIGRMNEWEWPEEEEPERA